VAAHPARRRGINRWTIELAAGPVSRSVACQVGSVWRVDDTIWRSVSWQPQPERADLVAVNRLLPTFRSELGLRTHRDILSLTLRGAYAPPAGRLGAAADAAALHRVAQHTGERFLADVAIRLQEPLLHSADRTQDTLAPSTV